MKIPKIKNILIIIGVLALPGAIPLTIAYLINNKRGKNASSDKKR